MRKTIFAWMLQVSHKPSANLHTNCSEAGRVNINRLSAPRLNSKSLGGGAPANQRLHCRLNPNCSSVFVFFPFSLSPGSAPAAKAPRFCPAPPPLLMVPSSPSAFNNFGQTLASTLPPVARACPLAKSDPSSHRNSSSPSTALFSRAIRSTSPPAARAPPPCAAFLIAKLTFPGM